MAPLAEEAGLKLVRELHSRLPHITADAMSVKQILFNLLANAIKFTKSGDVRVVTGLGFDRSVFVAVQDTGPGMTAEQIAKVLETSAAQTGAEEGGRSRHRPAARAKSRESERRTHRDRQHARRRHGRGADIPQGSRRDALGARATLSKLDHF